MGGHGHGASQPTSACHQQPWKAWAGSGAPWSRVDCGRRKAVAPIRGTPSPQQPGVLQREDVLRCRGRRCLNPSWGADYGKWPGDQVGRVPCWRLRAELHLGSGSRAPVLGPLLSTPSVEWTVPPTATAFEWVACLLAASNRAPQCSLEMSGLGEVSPFLLQIAAEVSE